jgi:hypothetical protein
VRLAFFDDLKEAFKTLLQNPPIRRTADPQKWLEQHSLNLV